MNSIVPIKVLTSISGQPTTVSRFTKSFRIGRADCDLCVPDEHVSRNHVEVTLENGEWRFRDLGSSNGTYLGDKRVDSGPIAADTSLRLGVRGPRLEFEIEKPPALTLPAEPVLGSETMVAQYVQRYFGKTSGQETLGERTQMIRRAFTQVQKRQRSRYGVVIAALCVLAAAGGGVAFYEHQQASKQKATAENIFYAMKSLDIDIANLQQTIAKTAQGRNDMSRFETRRKEMEKSYDQFLTTLHVYNRSLTPQEQLILRVSRIFGECELAMPPQFESEIKNYIAKWQSSGRMARAVKLANERGYTARIAQEFMENGLPAQFFYLALQESDFDPYNSGPPTYKGIAKGMWQFIPETGVKYGLHMGPLVEFQRPDPGDDRHNWQLETKAAANYIKDLYSTDAQASALLVFACYNWGEGRVVPLVRSMPLNPRERNFWQFLTRFRDKIPGQTYDYVFYIASAAVIGENPRLFGFDFDNPLENLGQKSSVVARLH